MNILIKQEKIKMELNNFVVFLLFILCLFIILIVKKLFFDHRKRKNIDSDNFLKEKNMVIYQLVKWDSERDNDQKHSWFGYDKLQEITGFEEYYLKAIMKDLKDNEFVLYEKGKYSLTIQGWYYYSDQIKG